MKRYSSKDKKVLKEFQCEYIRSCEETFARIFSENSTIKLFFINNNKAYTDGKNIVVDPSFLDIFKDTDLLYNAEKHYGLPHYLSHNRWNALKFVTRALNLHECLHLIYSRFPLIDLSDPRCSSRNNREVLCLISNNIEDVYINNVGSLCYDNIGVFLEVLQFCMVNSKSEHKSSAEEMGERITKQSSKVAWLIFYLNYMGLLISPLNLKLNDPPEKIKSYVDETKSLFKNATKAPTPEARYHYVQMIFDIIQDLIPEDEEEKLDLTPLFEKFVFDPIEDCDSTETRDGKEQAIPYTHVEVDVDGTAILIDVDQIGLNFKEQLAQAINEFNQEYREFSEQNKEQEEFKRDSFVIHLNHSEDGFNHQGIPIKEFRLKPDLNLKRAYDNEVSKYRRIIEKYSSLFINLLKDKTESREDGFIYGSGISSRRLGDPKKRYWYRNVEGLNPPDLEILILLDGSGSMLGERIENTRKAAIILHEVLERSGINHAIIEHRSGGWDPEVEINILKDFNGNSNNKYNLLKLKADGDNRDGLALLWCEDYFSQSLAEDKLMIVISDGLPNHEYDSYCPPASIIDTREIATKISRRGIKIIAVALDDENLFDCYELLTQIYPNIIGCNNLEDLGRQLLEIIRKEILRN